MILTGRRRKCRQRQNRCPKGKIFNPSNLWQHMIPPIEYVNEVGGNWEIGNEFVEHLKNLCGLLPSHNILDVGCGCGRMAVPLSRFLIGEYHGIDIERHLVDWCQTNIHCQNFQFHHSDIYNSRYNPMGVLKASNYKFPFPNAKFDIILLASVFTHMLPADLENYLSEISRTLRPGGKCLITYFLLNADSIRLMCNPNSALNFTLERGPFRINNEKVPEDAVAYNESFIRNLYGKYGLKILAIKYGGWCSRNEFTSFQDIIISRK